ncbi:response regulator transcription factor [Paeniglutamicibacter sp. ABSL32-1]|uniref:response regulator n=1 Tax=Paeniglutamicibacter quisquiliarum TaxID=2849498 RepID=UPI001C2CD7AF|nr:response regulator transcription factor [Paeniglutamicibacter quisquiliarum]MBV1779737.1 response regulator transcription factor [Paeniglutamicibacter quisquiliarum]
MDNAAATGRSPGRDTGPGTDAPIRVFILDDHELVRLGLAELLEGEGFEVVGTSGTAHDARKQIPALRPDVSVLDARLPDGTGIEVCRDVRSIDGSLNCLILTSYDDEQALRGAVLAGAMGYVLKQIAGNDLIRALRRAARGESLFTPGLKQRIISGLITHENSDPRMAALTSQERRVLELVGEGLSNRQIGERMRLAEKTVKNYVSSMLAKLGFESRTQAAVFVTHPLPGRNDGGT